MMELVFTELIFMKMRLFALLIVVTLLMPVMVQNNSLMISNNVGSDYTLSNEGLIEGVPYVWQEINGFCSWAAASIMFQSAGVPADMFTLFAASTVGFSFASARYNATLIAFPGVYYRQDLNTYIASQVFGLNLTFYLDSNSQGAELNLAAMQSDGISVSLLDGEQGAMNLMRKTIDRGHPLMISVDPIWLPSSDYDYLRNVNASGGAHGVVIVGYDDELLQATIMDPGVGSFGDNYGYPDDGRGNYTTISYWDLRNAWSARAFISITIEQSEVEPAPESYLGPIIRDRLLGVPLSYRATGQDALIAKYGQASFRDLSNFFSESAITDLLSIYDDVENARNFKTLLLLTIGVGLEGIFTLQYLSYRTALDSMPSVFPNLDLTDFNDAANQALPHFDAISSNKSLIYPATNFSVYTGLIARTFIEMATQYNSTGDLNQVLLDKSGELSSIANHLTAIADSWQAAGNSLAVYWPNDFLSTYGSILIPASVGIAAIIITIIYWIKRSPSQ
jgi:hypothetical protein